MTVASRLNLSSLAKTLKRNAAGMMLIRAYRFFFHWYYWGLPKFASWRGGGKLEIDEMTYRLGAGIIVRASNGGVVKIGKQVTLRRLLTIHGYERIDIGDFSRIGEMVTIRDHNHFSELAGAPGESKGFQSAPVIIGKNVWVGVKATIMPGVTIGDNAIIGANAVVTKDIPANAVAVGIPAKVIRIQTASKDSRDTVAKE
jgi:acetyltransferase-like isoleucine patch superfamily enzyme